VSPAGLTVGEHGFQRAGAPHQILSGALHYFRVHPDLWADRLHRLRAMGLNTVETYVAWNFHEPTAGSYDFTGWRDVARFIELAGEQRLDVIVRPGPYICAEWDLGGLPAWLLADPTRRLRCLDPGYLASVDRWFDVLIPRLAPFLAGAGGPIVAVQVENEYGSYGDDAGYLAYLRDGLRRRGVTGLLVTSDGPSPCWTRAACPGPWRRSTSARGPRRRSGSCGASSRPARRCAWSSGMAGSTTGARNTMSGIRTVPSPNWR
jgi:beta-galactosidase